MKNAIIFFAGLFMALIAHDARLYPHLSVIDLLVLAALRLCLLLIPLGAIIIARRAKTRTLQFILGLIVWAIFVPYTIYSAAEIRHVADWCRLPADTFFTDVCANDSWSLFPTFLYAATGVAIFCITLRLLQEQVRGITAKIAFVSSVILLTSTATTFGLITRYNVWNAFLHPWQAMDSFVASLNGAFMLNITLISLFTAFIYWSYLAFTSQKVNLK